MEKAREKVQFSFSFCMELGVGFCKHNACISVCACARVGLYYSALCLYYSERACVFVVCVCMCMYMHMYVAACCHSTTTTKHSTQVVQAFKGCWQQ